MCPALSPSFTSAPHLTFFSAPPPELSLTLPPISIPVFSRSLLLSHLPISSRLLPFSRTLAPRRISLPTSIFRLLLRTSLPFETGPCRVSHCTFALLRPLASRPRQIPANTTHKKKSLATHSTPCQLFTAASFPVILSTFVQLPASRELLVSFESSS